MRKKKRPITLLEIMIVILIIGLIGGVLGYNMKGSLDEGKAFKSRQGAARLEDILNLQIASFTDYDTKQLESTKGQYVNADYLQTCLKNSGMVKEPAELLKDGWGKRYNIKCVGEHFVVKSAALNRYENAKKTRMSAANKSQQNSNPESVVDAEE